MRTSIRTVLTLLSACLSLAPLPALAAAAGTSGSMQQYRLEKADQGYRLAMGEAPIPKPDARQVLVRVRAASLNRRDLLVRAGQYGRDRKSVV